ncbi:beta-1,4-N-acetylgalactosaminyltransferase bre-4-like [Cydia pomonella]|uniref:beta-1,4-N-acetylgalactosaminyltransferase bre-4-like n=1 Tax=Cydia pomonella TaxID=82600 RepID=UPI002ADDE6A8|nr:beta-1,4-N-acetylgalactosaminyltransferase bre-4-like [Cydia pomonella]
MSLYFTISGYGLVLTKPELLRRREYVIICFVLTFAIILALRMLCNTVHNYRRQEMLRVREEIPLCDLPPNLGPISVNTTYIDLEKLDESAFPEVKWGGRFSPNDCTALHKVAIIVPFRAHKQLLPIFLNHMHQFLMKQQLEYGIFIIEQAFRYDYFNSGKLRNVGFLESQNASDWQCFIFHDIDLLPMDQRNLYSCPDKKHPRQHVAAVYRQAYKLPYNTVSSGVSAMTQKQFTDVNGFSNAYWGIGGEDDDMVLRMHSKGYVISRYNETIARYASLYHKPNPTNKNKRYKWYKIMMEAKNALQSEGLSTLKYSVKSVVPHRLYTHIKADIGRSPTYQKVLKIIRTLQLADRISMRERMDSVKKELIAIL